MVKSMAKAPIIFAMANPEPEVAPEEIVGAATDKEAEQMRKRLAEALAQGASGFSTGLYYPPNMMDRYRLHRKSTVSDRCHLRHSSARY